MGTQVRELHARLRGLRERAEVARKVVNKPCSQVVLERDVRSCSLRGAEGFTGKRASDWAPKDVERFKVPGEDSDDAVVALVTVWSRWSGEGVDERVWRRQLRLARGERERERAADGRRFAEGPRGETAHGASHAAEGAARLTPDSRVDGWESNGGASAPTASEADTPAWRLRAARSVYWRQVRRIAPGLLLQREQELDELADFCTAPDSASYNWWRAPKWSGKTALMSWFALHPPPSVHIVPFFVTARYASQNDRDAFTEMVIGQLAGLLGEDLVSQYLTDAAREPYLLDLLHRAAEMCGESGARLVLLVDGLDEDRGVTTGPDAHSIAALLPDPLSCHLRVIVASRPNPPVPADVPKDHPLRDRSILRDLATSPHATAIQDDLERELRRLLHGTRLERDLLGLITAAGGGLSAADLADLTGADPWTVKSHLRTAAGRTFEPRGSRWRPEAGNEVYILGHEELQSTAVEAYGSALADYRDRVHRWAERHRHQEWPAQTPEYLFNGYFGMLRADDDLDRMIPLAHDAARHERMLDLTGSDTASLTEVTNVQNMILAQPRPGEFMLTMARLAAHRDLLQHRNNRIPSALPPLWAALGYVARAEALARTIEKPGDQAEALVSVARIAADGDPDSAETLARAIDIPLQRHEAMAAVVRTVASTDPDRARVIAERFDSRLRAEAEAAEARAAAASGALKDAKRLAGGIDDPLARARALLAVAWAAAAEHPAEAEVIALGIAYPAVRVEAVCRVAEALAGKGNSYQAARLVTMACRELELLEGVHPTARVRTRCEKAAGVAAGAVAASGDVDGALAFAAELESPSASRQARAAVAASVAVRGDVEWSLEIAKEVGYQAFAAMAEATAAIDPGRAEEFASRIGDRGDRYTTLTVVAKTVAAHGDPDRAVSVVGRIEDADARVSAFIAVAHEVALAGDSKRAEELARVAEAEVRTATRHQANVLRAIALALSADGDAGAAERVAQSIGRPLERAAAFVAVASALAAGGDTERALDVVGSIPSAEHRGEALACVAGAVAAYDPELAERLARSIAEPWRQSEALLKVVRRIAAADPDRAQRLARDLPYPDLQAQALAAIAQRVAAADPGRAEALSAAVGRIAAGIHDHSRRRQALVEAVRAVTATRDLDRAEALALTIPHLRQRWQALIPVVGLAGLTGQPDRALTLIRQIDNSELQSSAYVELTRAAARGDIARALSVAQDIPDPRTRATAFVAVATEADVARASALLVSVLATTEWTVALGALARLQPGALSVLADEWLRPVPIGAQPEYTASLSVNAPA